jgi:2-keto-3-deoxy-6-phosphogluconate aldolase
MRGSISIQSKNAIAALIAAGFKRSEFSVRTERVYECIYNGRPSYHLGDAIIYIRTPNRIVIDRTDALVAAGLTVTEITSKGYRLVATTRYGHRARLITWAEWSARVGLDQVDQEAVSA